MRVPVVPVKEMLQRALADRYGVAAFDVLDDLTIEAVLAAPAEAAVRVF
jgi:fructose-bisphosphate aldolase class II